MRVGGRVPQLKNAHDIVDKLDTIIVALWKPQRQESYMNVR